MNSPIDPTITLHGYHLTEKLYNGSKTIVYRGIRRLDALEEQQLVAIKLLQREYPDFNELLQFRNQYTIAKNLDHPGIVRSYSLEPWQNSYVLVMEDFGGISLRDYVQERSLPLTEFLDIALQMADILNYLYHQHIIHKDIKPANILIHPETKQVKLIDFSIASLLPKESQEIKNPNVLEGTLAYLSPEQTGRMNRGIDYRSDFYSLGVTFYQLLTGKLPFQAEEPLDLLHCHLAKVPVAVHEIAPDVPLALSQIVAKLMAKNAEERYQSSLGLKYDLEICRKQLQETGKITPFKIAQRDTSDRFIIPEKLYGREAAVQTLLAAFERVSQGETEPMLVSGFSGIGKTAVINEVHKPIVRQKGYFIKGKYDQFNRNIPFSAFVQAFRDLMAQLLSESHAQVIQWQTKILAAVGENGQVIIDVVPELEQLIGKQPAVVELSGSAAQNRFNLVFQKFVQAFTSKEHPLVIFLDDLQWADSASLQLLQLLMSDIGHLLILGAYRDNEVSPVHPLMLALDELKKLGKATKGITLPPLTLEDINQLVADTLNCDRAFAQPLTELVYQKTQGNPFFAIQFLKALYQDGFIHFNSTAGYWQCDISQIKAQSLTNDVVEFMALQLQKLPAETRQVLKLAACIGAQFDLQTLAIVSEQSEHDTAAQLWKALQEGLIVPQSEVYKFYLGQDSQDLGQNSQVTIYYKFLHDRVQQAAYSLIAEEQKKTTHLKIGNLLLEKIAEVEREERIFEIVNQLNVGIELIDHQTDRDQLAQLNLVAGRKAKAATAYAAAVRYLTIGMGLLSADSWENQYDFTFEIYLTVAEAEYLNSNFERSQELIDLLLAKAKTLLEKIRVYETKVQVYSLQNNLQAVLDTGLLVLELLGINLEKEPPKIASVEELIDLPEMTDPYKILIQRLLTTVNTAAFMTNPGLATSIMFTRINLCINYGNSPDSTAVYAYYGLFLCAVGNINTGYRYGQLALKLVEKFNARELQPIVICIFDDNIRHWKEHLKETINPLLFAYTSAIEVGNLTYSGYAGHQYCCHSFFCGENLEIVEKQHHHYFNEFKNNCIEFSIVYTQIGRQLTLNLLGYTTDKTMLIGIAFNELEILPELIREKNGTTLVYVYVVKTILFYLFERSQFAIESAMEAEKYIHTAVGLITFSEHNFYYSLSLLAEYFHVPENQQHEYLEKLATNQKQMQLWAEHAPMNYLHKWQLVEAEKCRVLGQNAEAIKLYDQAIQGANENEYIQEEALANELAAKFYLNWGKEKVAASYMQEAYYCYSHWGAKAKVEDLTERYPQLLAPILQAALNPTLNSLETLHTIQQTNSHSSTNSISSLLDINSIITISQYFYSEIHLDQLVAQIIEVVVKNAGANRGALLLNNNGNLEVAIAYFHDRVQLIDSPALDSYQDLPKSIIYYVERTLKNTIASQTIPTTFAADPYFQIHSPQSLLCVPILKQGKLIGILYLENDLIANAFTPERVELLKFFCTQAAISLENARLYQQSQQALTDLKQAQLQIIQSEKMSALGNLVSGIAHEINNPVGFLGSNIQPALSYISDLFGLVNLYQEKYPHPDPAIADEINTIDLEFLQEDLPKLISSMQKGVDRIREISTSLRTFSRADSDRPVAFNIHDGLDSTILILKHRLKPNEHRPEIKIVKNYQELPMVECYAGQLNQVFMNILANGIDALEESNGDRSYLEIQASPNQITITTELDPTRKLAIVRIQDNGVGMNDEVKARIFDHLFTTKGVGKGTGLGLAIARQIVVEKHHGAIAVNSTLGVGTEFVIQLPLK
jgi:predicted ATPase/signal transduction histidine kinase